MKRGCRPPPPLRFGQVAALYFSFDFPMNPPRLLLFNYFYRRSPLKMKTKTRDNFLRGDQEQEKSAGFIFGPYFYLLFHSASASFGPKNKGRIFITAPINIYIRHF